MPNEPISLKQRRAGPLSIEQLETGLRSLGRGDIDHQAFWDENIEAFRRTALFAIRETADALLSSTIPLHWRAELEGQLKFLVQYIDLADRYLEHRSIDLERRGSDHRPYQARLH